MDAPNPPHSSKKLHHLHLGGKYARLIECAGENLDYMLREYGFEHKYFHFASMRLAFAQYELSDFAASERTLRDALITDLANRNDFKERNANIYSDLTQLYLTSGKLADAELALKEAETLASQMLHVSLTVAATLLLHRARLLMEQQEYATAENLLQEGIRLTAEELGQKHVRLGVMLDILSRIYDCQGRIAEAEQTIRKSLESYHTRETSQYAWSLAHLAKYVAAQGRRDEAQSFLTQGLEILRRVRPPEHPDIVTFETRLADLGLD